MIEHGGSLAGLVTDIISRPFFPVAQPPPAVTSVALRRPTLRFEASGGTGPP
jgi:hypothetical protein